MDGDTAQASTERDGTAVGLAIVCALGVAIGLVTAIVTWRLYPPARGLQWVLGSVVIGSATTLLALYGLLARWASRRAGDWLVVGYALAVLLVVACVMAAGAAQVLRVQVAPTFGVPTGAVDPGRRVV